MLVFFHLLINFYLLGSTVPKAQVISSVHPLHVSTLDVNYGSEGRLEVICTIFTDDFESALSEHFSSKTDLSAPALQEKMDVFVKKYIEDHLIISSNSKTAPLRYLGFEKNREVVNVYLESEKVPIPRKIEVQISVLHNIFKDQMNILHVTVNNKRNSTKLDFPEKNSVFEYK